MNAVAIICHKKWSTGNKTTGEMANKHKFCRLSMVANILPVLFLIEGQNYQFLEVPGSGQPLDTPDNVIIDSGTMITTKDGANNDQ